MYFAPMTNRISPESSDAWSIHARAREMVRNGTPVIVLSIGEPDFATPNPIIEAAISALHAGRTHYLPAAGSQPLREAAAKYHMKMSGQKVTSDNVIIVPGAQCGLYTAAVCVLGDQDSVIVPEPTYVTYEGVIGAAGAEIIPLAMRPENHFHIDPAELEALIRPNTRAIMLNTPHNPTGAVMKRDTLAAIGEIARAHDLWILSDEVYAGLTFEAPHVSPAGIPGLGERTATIFSLSKSYAMTGWRIGWIVAPPELIQHAEHLLESMLFGTAPFIQDAALAAITSDLAEVEEMRDAYWRRRDLCCERLRGNDKIICHKPQAGMYLMIDVRSTGLSGIEFADRLLDRHHVALLPGEGFGVSAAGHVRLGLCASDSDLEVACDRLLEFVDGLNATG